MISDKDKLEWIASHLRSFTIGLRNNAKIGWFNEINGNPEISEIEVDNPMQMTDAELFLAALEKAMNDQNLKIENEKIIVSQQNVGLCSLFKGIPIDLKDLK